MEGALASSLFASASDSSAPTLIEALASMSGRVAFNAWPTGVAVTAGQHHGGPYPASTSSLHTSVGTQAINRFLRPVTFQGLPDEIYSALQSTTTKEK
jgi:NADP-dependent aldehyde dehydrogenase